MSEEERSAAFEANGETFRLVLERNTSSIPRDFTFKPQYQHWERKKIPAITSTTTSVVVDNQGFSSDVSRNAVPGYVWPPKHGWKGWPPEPVEETEAFKRSRDRIEAHIRTIPEYKLHWDEFFGLAQTRLIPSFTPVRRTNLISSAGGGACAHQSAHMDMCLPCAS